MPWSHPSASVLQTNLFVGEQRQLRFAKAIEAVDKINRQPGYSHENKQLCHQP